MVRITVVYSIVSISIIALSFRFVVPFFKENLPHFWASLLGAVFVILCIAPFLRAIMVKKNHSVEFVTLWHDSRTNRAPLVSTIVIRIMIAALFVIFVISGLFKASIGLIIGVAVLVVLLMVWSRRLKKQSILIERRFFQNLRSRDVRAEYLGEKPYTRKKVIEAFFKSTFAAWENYYTEVKEDMVYVGYSPAIGIDAARMVKDFPDMKIIHIVRNPFSAYRDTKRRPFPQPLSKYLITWNIYHSTVEMYAKMYPKNVRIFRYEDLVADKSKFMKEVSEFVGVKFNESMLYPSWNGKEIKDMIAPWGTVLKSDENYNKQIIDELSDAEKQQIVYGTTALARHFGYDKIDYLKDFYA